MSSVVGFLLLICLHRSYAILLQAVAQLQKLQSESAYSFLIDHGLSFYVP